MSYKDKYVALNNARGNTVHDMRYNATKQRLENTFSDGLSYFEVFFNNDLTPRGVNIIDDSESRDRKRIIVKPSETINTGDYVNWLGEKWIVILTDNMGDVYHRGTMIKCVSSLKWLNANGFIREVDFAIKIPNGTNLGIDQGAIITLPNERRYIVLQNNSDSTLLVKGNRFIFDDRVWKSTSIDKLEKNLIAITLEEDAYDSARDNMELRIADYYNNLHTYTLTITNGDTADIVTGETLQLNVELLDNDVVSTLPIVYTSSNESVATVNESGLITTHVDGTAIITAQMQDDANVNDSITINAATVIEDNFLITMNGSDVIKQGQSLTYDVVITNNGVADNTKTVSWTLLNDAETGTTDLAEITSSTETSCVVKCLKYNDPLTNSYFKLRAVCVEEPTLVVTKRIQARSVF